MLKKSILSGILISLGCWCYLAVGGIPGAVGFGFGLLCVCYFGIPLYTGKAGIIELGPWKTKNSLLGLGKILLGNIIGCGIMAFLFNWGGQNSEALETMITGHLNLEWYQVLVRGIGCGLIMELIVYAWREKNKVLPILFGVPIFILTGQLHSIATGFYYLACPSLWSPLLLWFWVLTVLGNFIGCNIRRLFI